MNIPICFLLLPSVINPAGHQISAPVADREREREGEIDSSVSKRNLFQPSSVLYTDDRRQIVADEEFTE